MSFLCVRWFKVVEIPYLPPLWKYRDSTRHSGSRRWTTGNWGCLINTGLIRHSLPINVYQLCGSNYMDCLSLPSKYSLPEVLAHHQLCTSSLTTTSAPSVSANQKNPHRNKNTKRWKPAASQAASVLREMGPMFQSQRPDLMHFLFLFLWFLPCPRDIYLGDVVPKPFQLFCGSTAQ